MDKSLLGSKNNKSFWARGYPPGLLFLVVESKRVGNTSSLSGTAISANRANIKLSVDGWFMTLSRSNLPGIDLELDRRERKGYHKTIRIVALRMVYFFELRGDPYENK